MRVTLTVDDALLAKARAVTGLSDNGALISRALKLLIQRESARRLARLGGSEPELRTMTRRRPRK